MGNPSYGWVEIVFTASVVFGLGFWQLWSLRRDEKREKESGRPKRSGE